jgi:hypothetical protein
MHLRNEMNRISPERRFCRVYDLLDQVLRVGSVTSTQRCCSNDPKGAGVSVQDLCDRGLLCQLFRARDGTSDATHYVITDWGRVVWEREKRVRTARPEG